MSTLYEFQIPTKIIYGIGCASKIGDIAADTGKKSFQLITDKGVMGAGIIDCLKTTLEKANIKIIPFDEVEANPTVQTVDKAFAQYLDHNCQGVIAVGGGSPMDTGKSVAILATNPGSAVDYIGVDKVKNPSAPLICIPTTAGTAAEITCVAILSDPVNKIKKGIRSPHVAPDIALLDPLLTLSLPPAPTRESGLDALSHAIESYISVDAWNASDALTLKAIELIGRYLRNAVHIGSDIVARDGMLQASLLAGMGFLNTRLCLVHAITGPLGGIYNLSHGVSNAIVLPHAMRFMLPGSLSKYVNIANALGENVEGMSERRAAEKAIQAVEQLSEDVGLPKGLSIYGVIEEELPTIAETISQSFMIDLSPRKAAASDILEICKAAL